MGGQKFQYDESGGTFFYFLLSFLALLLIPGTYYWWPRKIKQVTVLNECHCGDCKKKKLLLQSNEPWKGTKQLFIKLLIISGWMILILLAYKVSQFDYEYANFDPYEILGVPLGSSQADIKKSYRKLSLILHPDKETGNEKAFMKLTKAYQALTDDEARRNWEKYGNPDGPGAMSFGIALPSWIVEKENSVWVLGLYALVFMVALPTVVGMWWYKSIRYSGDQVLLDTTQMYYYFFHKTPSMALKRVIMILAASLEFEKKHNGEIVERSTDNEEVPHLIKQIPNLSEKNRERPLCFTYSIKARALLHAHLNRIPLNPETLDKDRQYIVKKCPYLIQEMVNCVSQLILLAYARRILRLPNIETIENCMKLCPMIVQGMWEYKSPLLQLPHITEENLKYFSSKKRHIKSIQQFVQLTHAERRHILRNLSDEQYEDVMNVVSKMPHIDFQVRSEVIDDENPTVYTAGAIVTVTVTLVRYTLSVVLGEDTLSDAIKPQDTSNFSKGDEEEEDDKKEELVNAKKPVWQKQQKKGKKGGKKNTKNQKPVGRTVAAKKSEDKSSNVAETAPSKQEVSKKAAPDTGDESEGSEDDADHSDDDENQHSQGERTSADDDDTEWEKLQRRLSKREKALEGKRKQSHSVHCPSFPEDKQEYWWVYISDRKSRTLLTSPYHVTALVHEEEVQLRFTAPRWPGVYTFTVCLRSDSYLGFDQTHDIKLDVKEAPEVPTAHPQWDMLDDEEEEPEADGSDVSEFTTDEDVEDEQD
ncbi:Translocation protein SEC63-like protein [Cryptotermes secundus]|uniref:Translocation protein SEC63-like protein n=1 Tax=Cryptotermes secundus TaxID=105785 RepID=A0A2J7QQX7_9NEOP|nr:translocation protein SEC63 homolog isoform X1 [Cryptotermes secundus]PNF30988.1 Translocation protein SEC63-like protein [Cryptotermes secundus]